MKHSTCNDSELGPMARHLRLEAKRTQGETRKTRLSFATPVQSWPLGMEAVCPANTLMNVIC